ncbi:MAG: hypothetical protein ISS18_05600 [Bacteroidales bacterium]|nr:hypothetical protein [Bacteroidales bacterium]
MKTTIISLFLIMATVFVYSQTEQDYMMIMVKQKKAFKMAQTEKDFQDLANSFERIANTETDKWHPLYYAAFCYINLSFVSEGSDKKDSYLDKAQTFIDKAIEIYPEESELFVLQGLLYQGRIQIDPETRGRNYSMKAGEALNQAKKFNPDNPRAYYLLGMNVLHIPEAFGGGIKAACPLFKTAMEKYRTTVPDHVLSPTWGGEQNQQQYAQNCGEEE